MRTDPNREPVHFGYINRRLMECLPADVEEFVCPTILGLLSFSGQYLKKPDLEAGRISFGGTVSYGQLAAFCKIDYETAKWRVKQLRERWGLVDWKRTKLGISFKVSYTGNGLTDRDELELPSQVIDEIESGNESSESGNRLGELGNGLPTLSLLSLKKLSKPLSVGGKDSPSESRETLLPRKPTPTANSRGAEAPLYSRQALPESTSSAALLTEKESARSIACKHGVAHWMNCPSEECGGGFNKTLR